MGLGIQHMHRVPSPGPDAPRVLPVPEGFLAPCKHPEYEQSHVLVCPAEPLDEVISERHAAEPGRASWS